MTALPYLKFYCCDWRADPRLRMCSLAARGLWIDLMSYMHEGQPYGYLTIDGRQPDLAGIAALVARPVKEVRAALAELDDRNIFSRGDDGAIYSRRMVRDKAKVERDRANGKGGGNPILRGEDNGGVNPRDKAQIPEVRDQKERKKESLGRSPKATRPKPSEEFSEFWKSYPRRLGANPKAPAFKVFDAVVKQGADPQAIIAGAKRCAAADHDKIGTPYIPQAVKWLRDRRWEDYAPDTPNAGISDAEREKLFAELRTKSDGKNETQGRNVQPIGAGPCQGEGLGRPKPALPADDQTGQPGVVGMAKILQ